MKAIERSPAARARTALLGLIWLAAVAAGTAGMAWYTRLPGQAPGAPRKWPGDASVARDAGRPTLLLFLHPGCPCSRATLAELERLSARAGGRCAVRILFVRPPGAPEGWERGALWNQARAIAGAAVMIDRDGADAARFRAETSGWTLLYGADGALLFQGGITRARGHEGDNGGEDALTEIVRGKPRRTEPAREYPVFGCALGVRKGTP